MGIVRAYKRYSAAYKNYASVMWALYRKKDLIDVTLRDGSKLSLSPEITFELSKLIENGAEVTRESIDKLKILYGSLKEAVDGKQERIIYQNNDIIMHGIKDVGGYFVYEVYIQEDYKFLRVNDMVVIDVGANIGDSAIYFALNGARRIIALEPHPYLFSFALRNVRENNLEGKIELLNAGYGHDEEIFVDEIFNPGTELIPSQNGKKIKIYSLKSLIEKFSVDKVVLKMDCEGCEYNLLDEDNSILAKFSQIQIEYHYGYERLVSKLENVGFNVKCTKARKVLDSKFSNPKLKVGWIYAAKS
jgi:FkbM family methyltransferase